MSLNMHKNRWIFLNVPECMNIPEYAWINCSHYARVLNMPRYSYNNIIIFVTKVIRLEFFSATISSFFNTSWNIRIMKASKLLISFSFWLQWCQSFWSMGQTKLCHHPTPAKIYPPPPTTSQNISITHHYPPPPKICLAPFTTTHWQLFYKKPIYKNL